MSAAWTKSTAKDVVKRRPSRDLPRASSRPGRRSLRQATVDGEATNSIEDEAAPRRHCGEVEADGITNSNARDPPGPSTVHIPHGDHRKESYRVATFSKFPKIYPVNILELACSGFYWTGYKDMVRCFSCGITVENWMVGDDESDPRWHKRDCEMARRLNCGNIPSFYSDRKLIFQQIYTMCQRPQANAVVRMPCSLGAQSQFHVGRNRGILVDDAFNTVDAMQDAASGHGCGISVVWKPRALGEIHSTEHQSLIPTLDLRSEVDRWKTFRGWPSYPAPDLAMKLAEEGFFYLGNLDRTQCFSCCGILRNWSQNDNPRNEHRKHFPNCDIVQGIENRNVPMSPALRQQLSAEEQHRIAVLRSASPQEPPDPTPEEKRQLEIHFPCNNPVNPEMESVEARLNSFRQSWPENRLKCTTRQLARAGFFYLGQGDRTKCYYCNGGLQNWEENDEPWTEHAKWFPGCEFILRSKGRNFVQRLMQQHPNLNRPQIRNAVSYEVPPRQPYEVPPPRPRDEPMQTFTGPPAVPVASRSRDSSHGGLSEEEIRARNLCRACLTCPADRLCQPCRHVSLCSSCAVRARNCPFCKSRIDTTFKVRRQ